MPTKIRRLVVLCAALLAGACATFSQDELNVRAVPRDYSPAMSSSIGIGLTPVFTPPAGTAFAYRWRANFGYFAAWAASGKVAPLGPDADSGDGTLYWTYDPRLSGASKPTVTIVVEAVERGTERVLASKKIKLDWDRDTAHVRDD